MLKFGFASKKITPGIGIQLAGFIGERKALGIHDDLFAKVLYLHFSDKNRFIFIVLDTIAVFKEFSQSLCEAIERETGIPKKHIIISATHTHSGPEGLGSIRLPDVSKALPIIGSENKDLIEYTMQQTLKAVSEAISKNYEGKFKFVVSNLKEKFCGSRRAKNEESPVKIKILLLQALSGETALVYNFGCHPTVLHENNLYISADFPGKVANVLSENMNNLKFCMFINGAAGDISTRFFRKESTFNEVNRIGSIIADSIKDRISSAEEIVLNENNIKAKDIAISLKIKKLPTKDILNKMLEQAKDELEEAKKRQVYSLRLYQSEIEGIKSLIAFASVLGNATHIDTIIKIICLDKLCFVGIPGEIFSILGKEIEESLNSKKVFIVGYCFDSIGYIPNIKAYEEGGYETLSTLLEKGEGERIRDIIIKETGRMYST